MVDADGLSARVTVLGEHGVEAVKTIRPAISHDVPLATELSVTFEAGEVLHVPGTTLSLRTLIRQDNLQKIRTCVVITRVFEQKTNYCCFRNNIQLSLVKIISMMLIRS